MTADVDGAVVVVLVAAGPVVEEAAVAGLRVGLAVAGLWDGLAVAGLRVGLAVGRAAGRALEGPPQPDAARGANNGTTAHQ